MPERFIQKFEDSGAKLPFDKFSKRKKGGDKEKSASEEFLKQKQSKISDSIGDHQKPPYPPGKWKSGDPIPVIMKKPTDSGPASAENAIKPDTVNKTHTDLDVRQSEKAQIKFETKLPNE